MTDTAPPAETPGPSALRDALARRVRDLLAAHPDVREVNMFGGLSFMVDERLAVSAGRDGDLLVRADPADYESLMERGATQARMRNGREMGRSWLRVAAARIDDDAELARWVEVGVSAAAAPAAGPQRAAR